MGLDRLPNTELRQRRMLQQIAVGAHLDGQALGLNGDGVATIRLDGTSLAFGPDGLKVNATGGGDYPGLNATGGIIDSTGLAIKLDGTSLSVGASGIKVSVNATGGLEVSTGLKVKLDGSTLTSGAYGLKVTNPYRGYTPTGGLADAGAGLYVVQPYPGLLFGGGLTDYGPGLYVTNPFPGIDPAGGLADVGAGLYIVDPYPGKTTWAKGTCTLSGGYGTINHASINADTLVLFGWNYVEVGTGYEAYIYEDSRSGGQIVIRSSDPTLFGGVTTGYTLIFF